MVILGYQVFIKCKYAFVCTVLFRVCLMSAFGFLYLHCVCLLHSCLCVFRLHGGQLMHILYWASENSSGPSVIVCLCVTDTSKTGGKASLATQVVSEPNLQLNVWLAWTTILSVTYPVCSYVCECGVGSARKRQGNACAQTCLLILCRVKLITAELNRKSSPRTR